MKRVAEATKYKGLVVFTCQNYTCSYPRVEILNRIYIDEEIDFAFTIRDEDANYYVTLNGTLESLSLNGEYKQETREESTLVPISSAIFDRRGNKLTIDIDWVEGGFVWKGKVTAELIEKVL